MAKQNKNSEIAIIPEHELRAKIFTIRGVQVMLDKDLADLYNVRPIRLREQAN